MRGENRGEKRSTSERSESAAKGLARVTYAANDSLGNVIARSTASTPTTIATTPTVRSSRPPP